MKCKDCIHFDVCNTILKNALSCDDNDCSQECQLFKDKSKIIELPCTPVPLIRDDDEYSDDVFCYHCGCNLSGCYSDGDQEALDVVQCYNCGLIIDNTKAITKEEAEQALGECENNG